MRFKEAFLAGGLLLTGCNEPCPTAAKHLDNTKRALKSSPPACDIAVKEFGQAERFAAECGDHLPFPVDRTGMAERINTVLDSLDKVCPPGQ